MPVQLHFLGWDAPVTQKVREFLIPCAPAGPVDLRDSLIVVPTRQAGRRLREAMALFCSDRGTALLSARVVPPTFFLHPPDGFVREAGGLAQKAVWAEILMHTDLSPLRALLPNAPDRPDFAWALQTGNGIQSLRATLADGGYRIDAVAAAADLALEEPERWAALARLDAIYLKRLESLGLHDPCELKIGYVDRPEIPPGVRRIVVAALPDPTLLLIRALESLAASWPIDILVHAPDAKRSQFDAWGRPLPDAWRSTMIPIPDPESNVLLAAKPEAQARQALREMAAEAHRFGPGDVGIGAPDRAIMPYIEEHLAGAGLRVFDPADRKLRDHSLYRLVEAAVRTAGRRSYAALRTLLRHPDVQAMLEHEHSVSSGRMSAQLDEAQNTCLPASLADLATHVAAAEHGQEHYRDLARTLDWLGNLLRSFDEFPPPEALRRMLQAVYAVRRLNAREPADREFIAAAKSIEEVLSEWDPGVLAPLRLDPRAGLTLILERLGEQAYQREAEPGAVDIEGWLELHWNDAPFLIVTGMNEGFVPDSRLSDEFLPDSLRARLKLRDDAGRLARDAYLMSCFMAARGAEGRVCFIAGKTSTEGDPLRPSRLLFRCGDDELLARATVLFGPAKDEKPNVPSTVSFLLNSNQPQDVPDKKRCLSRMSVTAFAAYLDCPFRFYLKNVLEMEPLDDWKAEPDPLDFGSLIHQAVEDMGRERKLRRCADPEPLAAFLRGSLERAVAARFGARPPLPVTVLLESARERLSALARLQAQLAAEGWEIAHTETKHTATVHGLVISGRIDRVDRHIKTGALRILDYKTSDSAKPAAEAHLAAPRDETPEFARVTVGGKARRWINLQLPLYRLLFSAAQPLDGAAMELGYINIPKAVTETAVSLWPEFTDDLYQSAMRCAESIVDAIREGRFWPPSPRPQYDDFETLFFGQDPALHATEPVVTPSRRAGE